jgi:hypothetical protein
VGSLAGRKLLEHVSESAVKLVRLLQHRVVADAFDGDRTEVGVLLVYSTLPIILFSIQSLIDATLD